MATQYPKDLCMVKEEPQGARNCSCNTASSSVVLIHCQQMMIEAPLRTSPPKPQVLSQLLPTSALHPSLLAPALHPACCAPHRFLTSQNCTLPFDKHFLALITEPLPL